MQTKQTDATALTQAGFTYEYPGFWMKTGFFIDATLSDGPTDEAGGKWSVQMVSKDGEYVDGSDHDTAADAIAAVNVFLANLDKE